jgi:hypothetical protein
MSIQLLSCLSPVRESISNGPGLISAACALPAAVRGAQDVVCIGLIACGLLLVSREEVRSKDSTAVVDNNLLEKQNAWLKEFHANRLKEQEAGGEKRAAS